jgi:hypothetical protein
MVDTPGADASPAPLTSHEIMAAVQNLEFFAARLKGVLAMSDKLKEVAGLLNVEHERRQILDDLDRQADAVRAIIATRDAAQGRLDGIQGELERHHAAAEAEAEKIIGTSWVEARRITGAAEAEAAKIIADAQSAAAAEASRQAAIARDRQAQLDRLAAEITARQVEHDGIAQAIAELRARIGAS